MDDIMKKGEEGGGASMLTLAKAQEMEVQEEKEDPDFEKKSNDVKPPPPPPEKGEKAASSADSSIKPKPASSDKTKEEKEDSRRGKKATPTKRRSQQLALAEGAASSSTNKNKGEGGHSSRNNGSGDDSSSSNDSDKSGYTRPGAFAMWGTAASDHTFVVNEEEAKASSSNNGEEEMEVQLREEDDHEQAAGADINGTLPNAFEAELVDPDLAFRKAQDQILQDAPEGQIVPDPTWIERNWKGATYCFSLLVIMVAISLGLTYGLIGRQNRANEEKERVGLIRIEGAENCFPMDTVNVNSTSTKAKEERLTCLLDALLEDELHPSLYINDTAFQLAFRWMILEDGSDVLADPSSDPYIDIVQRFVMANFYFATNGASWLRQLNFLSPDHVCEWYDDSDGNWLWNQGVDCNLVTNEMEEFHVDGNNLQGTISPILAYLKSLEGISLSSNKLVGTIPPQLHQLTALWYLIVDLNQLSGTLPSELAELHQLQYVLARHNQLTGTIPSEYSEWMIQDPTASTSAAAQQLGFSCNPQLDVQGSHLEDRFCKNSSTTTSTTTLWVDCPPHDPDQNTDDLGGSGDGCSCCTCPLSC